MKSVDELLKGLTLEEKASLCSGKDFWSTKAVERLGIPSWVMTDGPHGLRKQKVVGGSVNLHESVPATCFPTGTGLASTWNPALIEDVGRALGRESKASQVGVILGPAVNIKRSPLCGRNFEYLSEDPYLAGVMAAHHIRGVQSQGVGTSIKHFAVNNQERLRMTINAVVDERTLREIYLPAFEIAVTQSQPWTVMCSYNQINGVFASENRWLLTQLLKEEWKHTGLVVTDWGACDDRVAGLKAGQDFEMPGNGGITDAEIVAAVKNGSLAMAELDTTVRRILELNDKVVKNLDPQAAFDADEHHALARRVAAESMVLLKNDGLLPLKSQSSLAFVGAFARQPRFQGGGSSHISPTRVDDAFAEAQKLIPSVNISYAPGYELLQSEPDARLITEAAQTAAQAEAAVVFIGLTDVFESEGFDRTHLGIPASHTALLEAVLKVQKNVVVVLSNGAPIEMPWIDRVPAVLESYLGGQAWGGAVADLLFGAISPSGRLAETFPKRLEDTASYLNFPGDGTTVEYREGVFVGYRYHDAAHVEPLFPFGHGLSYTSFRYGEMQLNQKEFDDDETLTIKINVTNTGTVAGAEVVQLYVSDKESSVLRPVRELKAFAKVHLNPAETQTVTLTLDQRSFAFWSAKAGRWVVESGDFELSAGSSSRDLRVSAVVNVRSSKPVQTPFNHNSTLGSLEHHPVGAQIFNAVISDFVKSFGHYEVGSAEEKMMRVMATEMPLRNFVRMSGGRFPQQLLPLILDVLNGRQPESALAQFIPR
jgi:beta-glucosidase